MNTLLEFLEFTKGTSYLVAIVFLLAFIVFWQLMHFKGKGKAIRVIPLVILVLGLGGLVSTSVIKKPLEATASIGEEVSLFNSTVLVEMYGPAPYDHELHQIFVEDCSFCHHFSEDRTPPCDECHAAPFNPDNLNKPGASHVYHLRCISCHKEEQMGPIDCLGCHHKADVPPLSILHPLTGVENCLQCHTGRISGVPEIPDDHSSATNHQCQLCHKSIVDVADLAEREMPHGVEEHEQCLLCHGEGLVGSAKVPDDHAGRTDETCRLCHKTAEELESLKKSEGAL